MNLHNGKNWKKIAEYLHGRTDVQCLHRWQKVLDPKIVKGAWTGDVSWERPFSRRTTGWGLGGEEALGC